jgi:hypothetical protein
MLRSLLLLLFASLLPLDAFSAYERLLIPVYGADGMPGAFGSRWTSELVGRNEHDKYVEIVQRLSGLCGTCPLAPAQPHSTFFPRLSVPNPGGGAFVYVAPIGAGKVSFHARIQDVSRQALTWGTEIPIVRERDTFSEAFALLNIPADDRFRQTLRIYDFDGKDGAEVLVRVFPNDADVPLSERVVTLRQASIDPSPLYPGLPAMAQLAFADAFAPALLDGRRLRLQITPMTPSLRVWAFITVTNNETQHVTTITPH